MFLTRTPSAALSREPVSLAGEHNVATILRPYTYTAAVVLVKCGRQHIRLARFVARAFVAMEDKFHHAAIARSCRFNRLARQCRMWERGTKRETNMAS